MYYYFFLARSRLRNREKEKKQIFLNIKDNETAASNVIFFLEI